MLQTYKRRERAKCEGRAARAGAWRQALQGLCRGIREPLSRVRGQSTREEDTGGASSGRDGKRFGFFCFFSS